MISWGNTRRTLLKSKDDKQEAKRREENREKILLQETLKSIPRLKMIPLDSGRVFLTWKSRYTQLKTQMKNTRSEDWKDQVLVMAKDSLKIPQDHESCLFLTEVKEFEAYISAQSGILQTALSRNTFRSSEENS